MGEVTDGSDNAPLAAPAASAMTRLQARIEAGRGSAPVERWNPAYCGEIDMRIAADGTWFYQGSPIGRMPLVKLFASVLRKDPERFVLVTPVERVGIVVEDAPFVAVEMEIDGTGDKREIAFRTNVDDLVTVGRDHPLRFSHRDASGAAVFKPYVRVRGDLWALVSRPLAYDLAQLVEEKDAGGRAIAGIAAGGAFFPLDGNVETGGATDG